VGLSTRHDAWNLHWIIRSTKLRGTKSLVSRAGALLVSAMDRSLVRRRVLNPIPRIYWQSTFGAVTVSERLSFYLMCV
jgi:hypothetical protein